MRPTHILLVSMWAVLALCTLYLVVKTDNALAAALVAWTGGLLTHALGRPLYQHAKVNG